MRKHRDISAAVDPDFVWSDEAGETLRRIDNALARLSDTDREAYLMSIVEAYPFDEVAYVLNLDRKALVSRIAYAMWAIRYEVAHDLPPPPEHQWQD